MKPNDMLDPRDAEDYAVRFGGNCRDCADALGTCPNSGLPCDPQIRRAVIRHTISAINYGVRNGFLQAATAIRKGQPN